MMSGCGILTNGKGTRREYCEFSLDELQVRAQNLQHSPRHTGIPHLWPATWQGAPWAQSHCLSVLPEDVLAASTMSHPECFLDADL